jgi:cell division protein FtsB
MVKMSAGSRSPGRYFRPADAGCHRKWQPTKAKAALIFLAGFSLLVLMAAVFGQQGMLKVRELEKEKAHLAARVDALESRNDRLRGQVRHLQSDPFLYEKLARERLGLVKPGEVVYDFRPEPFAERP